MGPAFRALREWLAIDMYWDVAVTTAWWSSGVCFSQAVLISDILLNVYGGSTIADVWGLWCRWFVSAIQVGRGRCGIFCL